MVIAMVIALMTGGCSDFTPEGAPDVPELPTVANLKAEPQEFGILLTWTLPTNAAVEIEGVRITRNNGSAENLDGPVTDYMVAGADMGADNLYTVKVRYKGGYVSEGQSVSAVLPKRDLPDVTNLQASVSQRVVNLTWVLPVDMTDVTGISVLRDGTPVETLAANATSCELRKQPMGKDNEYTVRVVYADYYASEGVSKTVFVDLVPMKAAFLLLAPTPAALPDDDERAAADWFINQEDAMYIQVSDIAAIDTEEVSVIWIMVDREGQPYGWRNLPGGLGEDSTIEALKNFSAQGGSIYLSNMATQLAVPLGFVPDTMAPGTFGNGAGGDGTDVWTINPNLGWMFRPGGPNDGQQGFYDRTSHAIYEGLTFEDPNGYGYPNLPLIGPGRREDHNCLWDCNAFTGVMEPGKDVIERFENSNNCLVLATWGHVVDHCVAGLVDFNPTSEHGRCVANGFAAYEWNQNSGVNPYQRNIEQLTTNILNYLK